MVIITQEMIRNAYVAFLQNIRVQNPEYFVNFAEDDLTKFIRRHHDSAFPGIYEQRDHNYYDRIRNKIATNQEMRDEDDSVKHNYYIHLKKYSDFLQSKAFKQLHKQKINIEGKETTPQKTSETNPAKPKERALTEGEKKHVEFEQAHRNPALRQACINKYGYQCQCCGMNFAELYGEELGGNFIEVHHLKMISTFDESRPEDYLENLVPLCSNCHSMIHHGKEGPLTLAELRAAYKGEKKEIKVWKED